MVLKNNCLKNIKIPEASGQQSVNMHDQAVDYTGGHPEDIRACSSVKIKILGY